RVLVGLFEGIEIADRRAPLDAALRRDHSRLVQQRLGERGLARCAVPDERDGANVLSGELRHYPTLRTRMFSVADCAPAILPNWSRCQLSPKTGRSEPGFVERTGHGLKSGVARPLRPDVAGPVGRPADQGAS